MKKPVRRLIDTANKKLFPLIKDLSDAGFDSDLTKLVRERSNPKLAVDAIKRELGHPDALWLIPEVPLPQQWAQTKALLELVNPNFKIEIDPAAWVDAAWPCMRPCMKSVRESLRAIVVLRLSTNVRDDMTRRFYRHALACTFGSVDIDLDDIAIHSRTVVEPGVWVDFIDFGWRANQSIDGLQTALEYADDNLFAAAYILRDYFARTVSRIDEGWFMMGLEAGWPMAMHDGCPAEFTPGLWMDYRAAMQRTFALRFMQKNRVAGRAPLARLTPVILHRHKVCSL